MTTSDETNSCMLFTPPGRWLEISFRSTRKRARIMPRKNTTRRTFVGLAAAACGALVTPPKTRAVSADPIPPVPGSSSYLDILRPPDLLIAYSGLETRVPLARSGDHWGGRDIQVQTTVAPGAPAELPIHLSSP